MVEQVRSRIDALVQWARSLFPLRVWLHFLDRNGFLLAAGMSYQALFAVFAAVYVGISVAGIWLVGNEATLTVAVNLINTWVPGLLGEDGIVSVDAVGTAAGIFGWTGVVALGGLVWTAIGWITYSRLAVRAMFDLEKDTRNYVVMKARDLLVAVIFGVGLLVASALSVASTDLLGTLFDLFGLSTGSVWFSAIVRLSALFLVFVIDTLVLAAMFRFLSRAAIRWRRLWGGSALGGLALVGLQVLGSTLAGGVTRNPLLATFAVFVGLLLYFRLTSIVTLVAAAWIAVGAHDRDENLRRVTPAQLDREREAAEHRALLLAAKVRVREARVGVEEAGFFERFPAQRHLRSAEAELAALEKRNTKAR